MAKLGTAKRPIIVRVQTESRLSEIARICDEHGWVFVAELEPDKPEDTTDLEKLLNPSHPRIAEKTPGRNAPCPCGSGKKYKHCHGAMR
jgi:SWIM/SEC-C metal-binding protein